MNIYLASIMLLSVAGAAFGFGWYAKPPVRLTETVYRDGDVYLGEYAVINNSKFTNSTLLPPATAKSLIFNNNYFDHKSSENVVPQITTDLNGNMTVTTKSGDSSNPMGHPR